MTDELGRNLPHQSEHFIQIDRPGHEMARHETTALEQSGQMRKLKALDHSTHHLGYADL